MTESTRHHLVAVWNPAYGSDVVEGHVRILRELAGRHRAKEIDDEDVYVWWGKIRSVNRQQPLPHLQKILDLEGELGGEGNVVGRELQLYLTDYRSLYVAHVGEITAEDVREEESEDGHIPAFYQRKGINCDCWFRLMDIRRLISDSSIRSRWCSSGSTGSARPACGSVVANPQPLLPAFLQPIC